MKNFSSALIVWYKQNRRSLPWREINDPYRVWVSEIILQQTRVNQGVSYYSNFINKFPTVSILASATEDEVLKIWQGLGYYSRARNMHYTAKDIVNNYDGVFPEKYEDLLKLKGIGTYTAAAISSFCFNEFKTVLDGNVYRLISRVFGIYTPINTGKGKKEFEQIAHSLNDEKNCGIFNQAIMEFGAIHCTPKNPSCNNCIMDTCYALENNAIDELPFKEKKLKIKVRFLNYIFIKDSFGYTLIKKRNGNDIWKGLYEFPMFESVDGEKSGEIIINIEKLGLIYNDVLIEEELNLKHQLTHQKLYIKITRLSIDKIKELKGFEKVKITELTTIAFPKPLNDYVETEMLA